MPDFDFFYNSIYTTNKSDKMSGDCSKMESWISDSWLMPLSIQILHWQDVDIAQIIAAQCSCLCVIAKLDFVIMSNLSAYSKSLDTLDLKRYQSKLTITIDGLDILLPDPFNLCDGWSADPKKLPPTTYHAIYHYLVKTPGPFTGEAMEAYKSLDAYNYFISGHVSEVQQHDIDGNSAVVFVKGLVDPGQRKRDKPYAVWICMNKLYGYIVCAHCTCMAGLGEACSHIAAVLFAVDAVTHASINDEEASTSVKCIWSKYLGKSNLTNCAADHLDLNHPKHGVKNKRQLLK